MPWVPIHESGVEFQFYADGATLEGSLVRNGAGTRLTYFEFFMPGNPSRIRATCNYYSAGSGHSGSIYTPAYFSFWHPPFGDETRVTNQAPPYPSEHFEDDNGVIDFVPKVVESSKEADMVEFYGTYATSDYMGVDHAYEFLIEVWVDDPDELVANDDEATTNADTPVTVDVLANDTFNDEPVTLDQLDGPPTIHQQPANGTVSVAPDGKITYTPNPGFTGTDEFVYRIATPEPPEPSVICGFFGEGFAVISVPEGFSLDEPITFSVGDQSMEMHWVPWGGRWEPNFDDDYFYPEEGELAVMSQGGNSVEGNLVRGFVLTYAYGQVWMVGPEAPWFEFFVETEDGNTYYAMDNGGNYFAFTDEQPPIPPPGSPYPVKISYQDEVGENEFCGLMVTPTD